MDFKSNLKSIMAKKKMSVRELANTGCASLATINKARQDESIAECRLSTLGKVADELGVTTKSLFDEKGNLPKSK